uniref:Uncharacterized protein n=1 Tax=Arundo donax TaxID=35708 RepID=A0A0A9FVK7_ARUDO
MMRGSRSTRLIFFSSDGVVIVFLSRRRHRRCGGNIVRPPVLLFLPVLPQQEHVGTTKVRNLSTMHETVASTIQ